MHSISSLYTLWIFVNLLLYEQSIKPVYLLYIAILQLMKVIFFIAFPAVPLELLRCPVHGVMRERKFRIRFPWTFSILMAFNIIFYWLTNNSTQFQLMWKMERWKIAWGIEESLYAKILHFIAGKCKVMLVWQFSGTMWKGGWFNFSAILMQLTVACAKLHTALWNCNNKYPVKLFLCMKDFKGRWRQHLLQ